MKSIFLLVLLTFTTQIFADEYLPGRLESKVGQYKILAKCAAQDEENNCKAYYFFYSIRNAITNGPSIKLITPVAFSVESVSSMKEERWYFNPLNGGDSILATEDVLEPSVNLIWVPLYAALDVAGGIIGTPFFLMFKFFDNMKYNKLLKALRTGKSLRMGIQAQDILEDDICKMGYASVRNAMENKPAEFEGTKIGRCGFLKPAQD